MESVRQQKINKLVAKELAEIFRNESRMLFSGALITVTGVNVTPDLSLARVYVSILAPGKDKQKIFQTIELNNHVVRGKLGHVIGRQLRVVPELTFFLDDSLDQAMRIEELLKKK